jgi:oxygen-independent coproporphyrinogen-3 oxidase
MGRRQTLAALVAPRPLHPVIPARETRAHSSLGILHGTRPRATSLGLYVHVPFCAKRCYYCSFNTAPMDDGAMDRYVRAVRRELGLLGELPWARDVVLSSVFLGGGTPSLLETEAMASILDDVRARFTVERGAEVTVECNPESVGRAKLEAYRAAGVNRISLGVQTLDDAILPRLGRLHSAGQARLAFDAAREAGHDNVSVDVMYGLPGLDLAGWSRAVHTVLDWQPEHLSAYGLTLDAGSLWGVTGVTGLPPEGAVVEQYWALARAAGDRGFEHYEISNYARPGCRSRHNLTYWRAAEYLAAGPGACGFIGVTRYGNTKPVPRYCTTLEAGTLPIDTAESLTARQRLAEQLILGLRTRDGVPHLLFEERLATDATLRKRTETWREADLLIDRGDNIALTESGFLVSDTLFIELL